MGQVSRLKVFQNGKKAMPEDVNVEFDNLIAGHNDTDQKVNNLKSATTGESGAETVGSASISGVAGNTVYAQLVNIFEQIQNIVLNQIPNGTVTPEKLSFDPATQIELDAHTLNNDIHITSDERTEWNGNYTKPENGIPKTDLELSVQTSLGKADDAIPSSLKAWEKISEVVLTSNLAQVDFANLSGFRKYAILFFGQSTSSDFDNMQLTLNDMAGTSYFSTENREGTITRYKNASNLILPKALTYSGETRWGNGIIELDNTGPTKEKNIIAKYLSHIGKLNWTQLFNKAVYNSGNGYKLDTAGNIIDQVNNANGATTALGAFDFDKYLYRFKSGTGTSSYGASLTIDGGGALATFTSAGQTYEFSSWNAGNKGFVLNGTYNSLNPTNVALERTENLLTQNVVAYGKANILSSISKVSLKPTNGQFLSGTQFILLGLK